MTTIAYDHKRRQIAYDSRVIRDDYIIVSDDCEKMEVIDGVKIIGCGLSNEIDELTHCYMTGVPAKKKNYRSILIVVKENKVYRIGCYDGELWSNEMNDSWAEGSGSEFAIAALDLGHTAEKAVDYVKTRDIYTGGKTRVVNLDKR